MSTWEIGASPHQHNVNLVLDVCWSVLLNTREKIKYRQLNEFGMDPNTVPCEFPQNLSKK